MALKLYALLNDELVSFEELDAPDIYYQYYPSQYSENQKGMFFYSSKVEISGIIISC